MAQSARIDKVTLNADGSVHVQYTAGDTPLSTSASGLGILWTSKQDIVDAIADLKSRLSQQDLLLFAVAAWKARDANMATASLATGRTATVDLDALASVFSVS